VSEQRRQPFSAAAHPLCVTTDSAAQPSRRDEATEALFFAHYPRLARTAFALVGDRDVAEQLVSDAFLRRWRRWGRLRDQNAAAGYLQRTVLNLAKSWLRRRGAERRARMRHGMEPAGDLNVDVAADLALRHALLTLTCSKRAFVVLRYLVGLSEAETAAALGVSVSHDRRRTRAAARDRRLAPARRVIASDHARPAARRGA
jgi:RNA polymerase sigma factor (sigma-70 family)